MVDIILQNKTINNLGDYAATTIKLAFSYKIFIDQKTFMPVEVLQQTFGNKDTNTTFFTNINFRPPAMKENSWYASSYEHYTVEKSKEIIESIKTGVQAPDSPLTFFVNHKTTSINDFKGNVVLIEFWI